MDYEVITPSTMHPTRGYSHAVRMGDLVYVAGQVAQNQQGETVGIGDARAQTVQIFENLKAVLEAANSGLELIGKITIFTTNLDYRSAIAEGRNQFFESIGHYPASTFVVISSLVSPDWLVEIEAVAMVRK